MNSSVYLAMFLLLPAVVAAIGITWVAVGSRGIFLWTIIYLCILLYFPNNSFGLLDKESTFNFYDRGAGTFFFPAINILLFGLGLQAFVARRMAATTKIDHNLRIPAALFAIIFLGNVLVGSTISSVRWFQIIDRSGLLNVLNLMIFVYVLMSSIRDERDLNRLVDVILFCAITRGIWGLVRYFALGGDPANFYANFQHIAVKVSFFDINDSFIATVSAFICAWRLLREEQQTAVKRTFYFLAIVVEIAIVGLTHRRGSMGGLVIICVIFALSQRARHRYYLFAIYICMALPVVLFSSFQRTTVAVQGGSVLERLFPDVAAGGQVSFTTGRFSELYAAYLSLKESPIVGLGTWGQFSDFRFSELAWHGGNFSFMHSGILHIALKAGLIGAFVSLWALVAYFVFVLRVRREVNPAMRGIFLAGFGGTLFMLPNWFIGTPVIEFRTMQMIGLGLALPYIAYAMGRPTSAARTPKRRPTIYVHTNAYR